MGELAVAARAVADSARAHAPRGPRARPRAHAARAAGAALGRRGAAEGVRKAYTPEEVKALDRRAAANYGKRYSKFSREFSTMTRAVTEFGAADARAVLARFRPPGDEQLDDDTSSADDERRRDGRRSRR